MSKKIPFGDPMGVYLSSNRSKLSLDNSQDPYIIRYNYITVCFQFDKAYISLKLPPFYLEKNKT